MTTEFASDKHHLKKVLKILLSKWSLSKTCVI